MSTLALRDHPVPTAHAKTRAGPAGGSATSPSAWTRSSSTPTSPSTPRFTDTDVLAALLVTKKLRDDLAAAEGHLIEIARARKVTWARLADALEVKSRQAAERRYQQLRGDSWSDHARTQRERVDNERDQRAEQRARDQWVDEHAGEIRDLAVRLAAVEDLQQRADTREYAFQDRINRRIFPRPAYTPACWPADLRTAITADNAHKMFAEIRHATLPDIIDLTTDHSELVKDIAALHRQAASAGTAVLKERWDRRYGPDPDEDDTA
jgi:hypothetical protein